MKKMLMVHPDLNAPGGGNTVALWMLQALKDDYDITLLTWEPVNFAEVNRFFGTSLQACDVSVCVAPGSLHWLAALDPSRDSIQPRAWLMRLAKRMCGQFDVVISAEDEFDLGCRAIQYIHCPYLSWHLRRLQGADGRTPFGPLRYLLGYYYRPWRLISGYSFERMKRNLTMVNSDWTGRRVAEVCGIESITVYPPVPGSFPDVPWESREDGFVCIGRVSPEKELRKVIDVVEGVRAGGRDVHLHIVGTIGAHREEQCYFQHVSSWAEANSSWVSLHIDLPREQLLVLVAAHRYGIHGMSEEPFGIAVAEMVVGGCIAFAPNGGGQTEIVGGDDRLLYGTVDEAVAKIGQVLDHPQAQESLRRHLSARKELFSAERFMREIERVVRDAELVSR